MDYNDILTSIKSLKEKIESKFKSAFEKFNTKDGSVLIADAFEVGKEIKLRTADGDVVAPDGNHELEDGRVIVVKAGVIIEAREAPKAEVEQAAVEMSATPEFIAQLNELVSAINNRISMLADMIYYKTEMAEEKKNFDKQIKEITENQNKFNAEILALVNKIADAPSATPAQPAKDKNSKTFDVNEFKKAFKADLKEFAKTNNTDLS